jgi:hypothetical protein
MRFPQAYVLQSQLPSGNLAVSGAAPQTVVGVTLDSGLVGLGLAAIVFAQATTSTLTLAAKWQVLIGSTWTDVVESNNPANVVLVTGTGSAVSATKVISAPLGVFAGSRSCRCVVVSGVGSGAGGTTDYATISYDLRAPVSVYG